MKLLEFQFFIDGEQITLNEDLNKTLVDITLSYIKQKISGIVPKEKKVKVPKDPTAPKCPHRPHLTEQEISQLMIRGGQLNYLTASKAAQVVSKEIGRAWGTIYVHFIKAEKAGQLNFAPIADKFKKSTI